MWGVSIPLCWFEIKSPLRHFGNQTITYHTYTSLQTCTLYKAGHSFSYWLPCTFETSCNLVNISHPNKGKFLLSNHDILIYTELFSFGHYIGYLSFRTSSFRDTIAITKRRNMWWQIVRLCHEHFILSSTQAVWLRTTLNATKLKTCEKFSHIDMCAISW